MVTIFSLVGVYWVIPETSIKLLTGWKGKFGGQKSITVWNAIPPSNVDYLERVE